MTKLATYFMLMFSMTFLYGCPSMGVPKPQGFDQQLAYAYATNTSIRQASTTALNAELISSSDMRHIMQLNDDLRALLDAAKAGAAAGDIESAQGKLNLGLTMLADLQAYLRDRGVKTSRTDMEGELIWA